MEIALMLLCLGVVAYLYSAVGHGGASGYIAVLTLFSLPNPVVRNYALVLNILVSGIAFYQFYKNGYFSFKLFLPLAACSVPMAWLGGRIKPDLFWYQVLLGTALLIPAALFIFQKRKSEKQPVPMPLYFSLLIGAGLGFLSGITGIGGGVFLSPILISFNWAKQKNTAAVSAAFIFVNSVAGLAGSFSRLNNLFYDLSGLGLICLVCLAGGFLGSRSGAAKWSPVVLKNILALVLITASVKLFITAFSPVH